MTADQWQVGAGGPLHGELVVPGDKSISHRSLLFSALSEGETVIDGLLDGEDVQATAQILRELGVRIGPIGAGDPVNVQGVGMDNLSPPSADLDCGNSGTAMRLLTGVLAGRPFAARLSGDASLSSRPMQRVITPVTQMGAVVDSREGKPPLTFHASERPLKAIEYVSPVASAQVKSCVLLAGLRARGITRFREPALTRDHTERMLGACGVRLRQRDGFIEIEPGTLQAPERWQVPGDFSSAFFWLVAASILPGSRVCLRGVGMNPTRIGGLDVLREMGATIAISNPRVCGGEPVADLTATAATLRGIDIDGETVVRAIDEFPALFVAAACASGTTRIRDAAELRAKESDRIDVMAQGLSAMGIEVRTTVDGADIVGGRLQEGDVDGHGDHRCAMAFAIACARGGGGRVRGVHNVATSYPTFISHATTLGLALERDA